MRPVSQKQQKHQKQQKQRTPKRPAQNDPLAQQVEHNTFNVGVLGSSPKRITFLKDKSQEETLLIIHLKTLKNNL